jgi:hypothetical protein
MVEIDKKNDDLDFFKENQKIINQEIKNNSKKNIEDNIVDKNEILNSKEKKKEEKIKRTVEDDNSPYDNVSVWVAWCVLWPIAGAILSYISLKNLWNEYAKYVLLWGFLITIILTYVLIFIIPDTPNFQIWFLWLIFMLFQQKQVKKWSEDNPEKKYKSWFKALGWGIVGWILFFSTIFITSFIITPSTIDIENNINVIKEYPREVNLDDTFDIKFSINNIDDVSHKLITIDIDNIFLDGILITDISPKSISNYEYFWMQVYNFKENISNTSDTNIVFSAKAIKKWDFSGDVDFCIDLEGTCIYDWIRILVK